jgi:hypothetical protein
MYPYDTIHGIKPDMQIFGAYLFDNAEARAAHPPVGCGM